MYRIGYYRYNIYIVSETILDHSRLILTLKQCLLYSYCKFALQLEFLEVEASSPGQTATSSVYIHGSSHACMDQNV